MHRRHFIAATLACAAAPLGVLAQGSYPSKPITLIVPFSAGGAGTELARAAMNAASPTLGQPIIVDNRPGAGGNIAVVAAAKAPPDGYTLLLGHISPMVINPHTYSQLPVDPMKELAPIGLISGGPQILVVHPSVSARNLQELIAYAKANPGKLNYASAGSGGLSHVAMELLMSKAGTQMVHVPYKGAVPAMQDLLTGRVQVMVESLPQLLPYVKDGRLRAIAVTSDKRSVYIPEVPTAAESGLPDYVLSSWLSIWAPAKTPIEVRRKIKDALDQAMASKAYTDFLAQSFGTKAPPMTMEEFARFAQSEYERWGKVVRDAHIRAD
ncbi:Bug family tripartite tricarboxylate transporter substrate binding protein [Variovorax terrae]|uniref:Tripartite tricarboxylate transporter substrate binding protein n=1 Tax=Variovorax terrae TaxID=2923278 RepID=A0A9X1VTB9_9BURK|nr:tripartite tricarboxylate transporter substrate binding protein [Variovorax terrae]MCJ0761654.1 tripartite tricarboxylate transporter substrate binding protein [Variovorax terrae]